MAGQNIKQLSNLSTPTLADILYIVQSDTDYNVTLEDIKDLFGIQDVEQEQTQSIASGTTEYISFESSLIYGAIEIEYLAKRSGRGYTTGRITLLVDDSIPSGVTVSDFRTATRYDGDDLGLNMDLGRLSSGTIQLDVTADASDANPVVLNYKVVSKRKITVS